MRPRKWFRMSSFQPPSQFHHQTVRRPSRPHRHSKSTVALHLEVPHADSNTGFNRSPLRLHLRRNGNSALAPTELIADPVEVTISVRATFHQDGQTAIPTTALTGVVRTTTVLGDGQMQAAIVPQLRLGTDTLWDQPAVLLPNPAASAENRLDGLLPLSWFSEVTFNGRENSLVVRR